MTQKRTLSGKLLLLFVAMLSVIVISAGTVYAYVAGFSANTSLTQTLSSVCSLTHNNTTIYSTSSGDLSDDIDINAISNNTIEVSGEKSSFTFSGNSVSFSVSDKINSILSLTLVGLCVYGKDISERIDIYTSTFADKTLTINFATSLLNDINSSDTIVFKIRFNVLYSFLSYIESSGTQYVNTGFCPSSNTKVETQFFTSSELKWIFGSRSSNGSADSFGVFITNANKVWPRIGVSANTNQTCDNILNTICTLYVDQDYLYINNQKINSTSFGVESFETSSYPMYVGTINSGGSIDGRIFSGKIYYLKIWEGSTLVRDYVPCLDKVNNTLGLYDKINDSFCGNIGSGVFIAGEAL